MDPATGSDFMRPEGTQPAPSAARAVAGVGAVTLALGFVEACLHLQQRPIPLRFASRFAFANTIPSVVWGTVAAQTVAAASNLPLERLVVPATLHAEKKIDPPRANRAIAIKSVRSLRYTVASYGLVWSLWRWHETAQAESSYPELAQAHAPSGQVERVVRLTPVGSFLSKATTDKHGDHVVQIPWDAARGGGASIDWSVIGLDTADKRDLVAITPDIEARLKVLELEIDGVDTSVDPFSIAKRTVASAASDSTKIVAVVDTGATPEWQSRSNGVDIYFFALSGIIRFLCDKIAPDEDRAVILVVTECEDRDEEVPEEQRKTLQLVRSALTHRHGIPSVVGFEHVVRRVHKNDQVNESELRSDVAIVVLASTTQDALKQLSHITEFVPSHQVIVVVQESLSSAMPRQLSKTAGVLSVADLVDGVFQSVRVQLRAGISSTVIQRHIFEEFGEQFALVHRQNVASDITRYI